MREVNNIKLYTDEEVAEILSVAISTVSLYRRKGKIKATRIGKITYISESALNDFLEGKTAGEGKVTPHVKRAEATYQEFRKK